MYAALVFDTQNASRAILHDAIKNARNGKLDILVINLPSHLNKQEGTIRTIYTWVADCPDCMVVDTIILPHPTCQNWDVVWVPQGTELPFECNNVRSIEIGNHQMEDITLRLPQDKNEIQYNTVAVGGTFDHFHLGHKLLLCLAALAAKKLLIVGISGPELLVNKKYADVLDPYEKRDENVCKFLARTCPGIKVTTYMIHDVYGPTTAIEDIDALVVSHETAAGGEKVNEKRISLNWNPLKIIEVGLLPGTVVGEKLSSTYLRKIDYDNS